MTDNRYDELRPLVQLRVSDLINTAAANSHVDSEQLADIVKSATDAVRDAGREILCSQFERQRSALTAELDYLYPVRGNAFGHRWEHHTEMWADEVDPDGPLDSIAEVAHACWQEWQATHVPIVVTNWELDCDQDEIPRRFKSRVALLEEMIEQDAAAAHSGTLLTDILADDYNGDRVAMALDIGTATFDSYNVELAR